jgi:hypothetical protein
MAFRFAQPINPGPRGSVYAWPIIDQADVPMKCQEPPERLQYETLIRCTIGGYGIQKFPDKPELNPLGAADFPYLAKHPESIQCRSHTD